MIFRVLLVILLLIMSVSFGDSQQDEKKQPPKLEVHVDVNCDNSSLKYVMESYIKRELRSLRDVEIADNMFNQFSLQIIVMEAETVARVKTGNIFATYIAHKRRDATDLCWDPSYYDAGSFIDEINQVRRLSEEIVALFDGRVLERERQKRNAR